MNLSIINPFIFYFFKSLRPVVVLLLVWLFQSSAGYAQSWTYLGDEYDGLGVTTGGSDLAVAPDGTPYVAFTSIFSSYKITVMKFSGTEWVMVGPAVSGDNASEATIAVDAQGVPYAAYIDAASKPTVKKFNGTGWVTIGSPAFSDGTISNLEMEVTADGIPFVAYRDNANGGNATVMKFNGSAWSAVGAKGFSVFAIKESSLAVSDDGVPHLAFVTQSGSRGTVMKYNGTEWANVGPAEFVVDVETISLDIDAQNKPYVAFSEATNAGTARVRRFTGTDWLDVGPYFGSYGSRFVQIKIDQSTPYVVLAGPMADRKISIFKLVDNDWVTVGDNQIPGDNFPHLGFSNIGNEKSLYVVFGNGSMTTPIVTAMKLTSFATTPPTNTTPPANQSICLGTSTTLMATAEAGYTLTWYNSSWDLIGEGDEFETPFLNSSTRYYVRATGLSGRSDDTPIDVTVNPRPVVSISGDLELCQGESTTLTATGALTYQWQDGPSEASYKVTPSVITDYFVTGKNQYNCTSMFGVEVVVKPLNLNVVLTDLTLTAEASPATYQWINCESNGFVIGATNQTFTPTKAGSYAVVVSQNFCQAQSVCFDLLVTGVESEENAGIAAYPNPTHGSVKAISTRKGKVAVRNHVGQFLFEVELSEFNNFTSQIELVDGGIYYLTFTNAQSNKTDHTKVVVVR